MSALALPTFTPAPVYIHFDSGVAERETDYALLLDAVRPHSRSQTAVIYEYREEILEIRALAARSSVPARERETRFALGPAFAGQIERMPRFVDASPADEPCFQRFPEVFQYPIRRLAVAPLRAKDRLLGFLTLGRQTADVYGPAEIETAQRAERLLTAVLERDSLQRELAARKVIERAKGILQQRRKISEEHAHLLLRNNSRRRRIRMADVAKEIIEGRVPADLFRPWQRLEAGQGGIRP